MRQSVRCGPSLFWSLAARMPPTVLPDQPPLLPAQHKTDCESDSSNREPHARTRTAASIRNFEQLFQGPCVSHSHVRVDEGVRCSRHSQHDRALRSPHHPGIATSTVLHNLDRNDRSSVETLAWTACFDRHGTPQQRLNKSAPRTSLDILLTPITVRLRRSVGSLNMRC